MCAENLSVKKDFVSTNELHMNKIKKPQPPRQIKGKGSKTSLRTFIIKNTADKSSEREMLHTSYEV